MKFEYPSQLPVSTARDDIAEAVRVKPGGDHFRTDGFR